MRVGAAVWGQLLVAAAALCTVPVHAQRVLVVSSGDSPPYRQALAGIQKQGLAVEWLLVSNTDDAALGAALARAGRDSVVVTLGGRASRTVARSSTGATVVNCMMLGSDDNRAAANTPVVPLEIPIETQIHWLKRLLPEARTVGLLYDPAQSETRAADAAAALTRAGYQPLLEAVRSPSALPAALGRLTNNADVLHAIADTTVYAPEHSRALLLFSFRNVIPLTGPNEAWVRAGALYAVDWDYPDLGRYCLALGLRQLAGNRTSPPPPGKTRVIVNMRSAEQLRVQWDTETLRLVDRVAE
jgi:putative tryptophan/tyrosine transport system substrate-binding protein